VDRNFWAGQSIQLVAYALIAYFGGLCVRLRGVKVNYTRKVNFFALYAIPFVVDRLIPHQQTLGTVIVTSGLSAAMLVTLWKPIRSRVSLFQTMFISFDRPEDRPHTLLWLSTQILAGYAVLIPMSKIFARYGMSELIFIPLIIHGIGDGLAEPVGVRFGRHKYSTRTFLSRAKRHTRSYEGSACVFVSGVLAVAAFHGSFTPVELMGALLTVPILTTLAEAWSPHTWDTPYMFLVSGASLFAVKLLL
jgi:phytol kinase